MKRVFGKVEVLFDVFYLLTALLIGLFLLLSDIEITIRIIAGVMTLVLVIGDAFHLVPRIIVIYTGNEKQHRQALGKGKQITSITMTFFYLFMWEIGLRVSSLNNITYWSYAIYIIAAARVIMCLLPQNRWNERYPPVIWGVLRNIPFFIMGAIVAGLFIYQGYVESGLEIMGIAISLSFLFYLPVVLWGNKYPMIGILMLPKTCTYLWMLGMCLTL